MRVEPTLNPSLKSVYFLPDRAQVRNPRLLRALMAAIARRGGKLMPGCGVEGFQIHAGRVTHGQNEHGPGAAVRHGYRGGQSLVW